MIPSLGALVPNKSLQVTFASGSGIRELARLRAPTQAVVVEMKTPAPAQ